MQLNLWSESRSSTRKMARCPEDHRMKWRRSEREKNSHFGMPSTHAIRRSDFNKIISSSSLDMLSITISHYCILDLLKKQVCTRDQINIKASHACNIIVRRKARKGMENEQETIMQCMRASLWITGYEWNKCENTVRENYECFLKPTICRRLANKINQFKALISLLKVNKICRNRHQNVLIEKLLIPPISAITPDVS